MEVLHLSNGEHLVPVEAEARGRKLAFSCRYDPALVEEFKCMRGAEWLPDERRWAVTECRRNRMQLEGLQGREPLELARYSARRADLPPLDRPLMSHQRSMLAHGLSCRRVIWAAEQGTGKTLSAIELMERSGVEDWWYVAPLRVLNAVRLEFDKWRARIQPFFIHYDVLFRELEARFQCRSCGIGDVPESKTWGRELDLLRSQDGEEKYFTDVPKCRACGAVAEHQNLWRRLPDRPAPGGVVFDESSKLKNGGSKRAEAAQHLADAVRAERDGFVVLMSGTPAPRDPTDWHSQAEIACPGWLRESSVVHLRRRLAVIEKGETAEGRAFPKVVDWRHDEVERLYLRLKGLVEVHLAKDCLELPPLVKVPVDLPPAEDVLRAARLVAQSSTNAVQALNRLRQLSDGFQYGGVVLCSDCHGDGHHHLGDEFGALECHACGGLGVVDTGKAQRAPCPKDEALRDRLAANEEAGRIVVYGSYHASVDRIVDLCLEEGWAVLQCDGRGWFTGKEPIPEKHVNVWLSEMDRGTRTDLPLLAFVAHPGSGGLGLNLTAARECVFYSNDFNAESRMQAEKRCHRQGQIHGVRITDLFHLPTDRFVVDNLEKKRALQSVTMGEVVGALA